MRRALAAWLVAALVPVTAAAADEPRWYVQVDNDVPFGTDRWYTSGVRIARVHASGDYEIEWGVLQEIFTPEAREFRPGRIDRMPTARLLFSAARHDRRPGLFQTLEIMAGVRGPSALGEQTTELIHRAIPSRTVDWSRQDSDRVDASINAVRTHEWPHVAVHYGAALGTELTFAHAGVEWRFRDAAAIASPLLRYTASPPFTGATPTLGWNGFVGVSGRAIARNELIGRSYEAGAPDLGYERFVTRVAAGVTWSQRWGSVVFALAQDTRDFDGQRVPHRLGSLVVHIDF